MLIRLPIISTPSDVGEEPQEPSEFNTIGEPKPQEDSVVSEKLNTLEDSINKKFKKLDSSLKKIQDNIFTKIETTSEGNYKITKSYIDKKLSSTVINETKDKPNTKLFTELTDTLNTIISKLDTLKVGAIDNTTYDKSEVFDLGKSLPHEMDRLNKNIESLNKLFKTDAEREKEKEGKNNPILSFLGGIFGENGLFSTILGKGGTIAKILLGIAGGVSILSFLGSDTWAKIKESAAFKAITDKLDILLKKAGQKVGEVAGEIGISAKNVIEQNLPGQIPLGSTLGLISMTTGMAAAYTAPILPLSAALATTSLITGAGSLFTSHLGGIEAENKYGSGWSNYLLGVGREWWGGDASPNKETSAESFKPKGIPSNTKMNEDWDKFLITHPRHTAEGEPYLMHSGQAANLYKKDRDEWEKIKEHLYDTEPKPVKPVSPKPKSEVLKKVQESAKQKEEDRIAEVLSKHDAKLAEFQSASVTNYNNNKTIVDYLSPGVDYNKYGWHYDFMYRRKTPTVMEGYGY